MIIMLVGLVVSLVIGISSTHFGASGFFEMIVIALLSWILFNQLVRFMGREEMGEKDE